MFRLRLVLRSATPAVEVAAVWVLILSIVGPARARDLLINNGLDCSNPGNVIDDYNDGSLYVRNTECPPLGALDPGDPCPSPGAPTDVCLEEGAGFEGLEAYDSSSLTITGPVYLGGLDAHDSSTVSASHPVGGPSNPSIYRAYDSSTLSVSGGSLLQVWAYDSSTCMVTDMDLLGLIASGSSTVSVSGATKIWGGLTAYQTAAVTMSGGFATDYGYPGCSVGGSASLILT